MKRKNSLANRRAMRERKKQRRSIRAALLEQKRANDAILEKKARLRKALEEKYSRQRAEAALKENYKTKALARVKHSGSIERALPELVSFIFWGKALGMEQARLTEMEMEAEYLIKLLDRARKAKVR